MAGPQTMERPRRWDLPFSRESSNTDPRREMGDEVIDRLLAIEPFRSMDPERFPGSTPLRGILRNDARLRRYRHGEVIVRQGDYGNSAFLILQGRVRVILEGLDDTAVGRRPRQRKGWLDSLRDLLTNPRSPEVRDARLYPQMQSAAGSAGDTVVVQDVTNVLRLVPDAFERTENRPMEQGELFGELAALGRVPRSATVVADGDAELLEIRWQGLRDLRKFDDALRQHIDEQYRKFGLSETLRASPLLRHLGDEDLDEVARQAQFETHGRFDWYGTYQQLRAKGGSDPLAGEPVIVEQGSYPDGLLLIRAGFARLSQRYGNGERTLSYLAKGDIYGLAELVHNARTSSQTPMTLTLRAMGYVDAVRIPTRVFEQRILPRLPEELIPRLPGADADGGDTAQGARRPGAIDPTMMESLVEHRFINGTATMMIDLDRCTRCDDCVRACASGHSNNPRFVRHGTTFGHYMIANACMHCMDPVCMIGCPTGAIHRDQAEGQVVINDITCIGCGVCASSCPYDNIRLVEVRDASNDDAIMVGAKGGKPIVKATKCDLCIDHVGGPACQRACPHDALQRVDMRDLDFLGRWLDR